MYDGLGGWPTPSASEQQTALTMWQSFMGGTPAPWIIPNFAQSVEGRSLDPSSEYYGITTVPDPRGALWYLGWWDALKNHLVPATKAGAEQYRYWMQSVNWNLPVPAEVRSFFANLPEANTLYQRIEQINQGVRDGTLPESDLRKIRALIDIISAFRKLAYLQSVGLPPDLAKWIPADFLQNVNVLGRIDEATLRNVCSAYLAGLANAIASENGIPKPFPQIGPNDIATMLKVGLHFADTATDDGEGVIHWADFLPDLSTAFIPDTEPGGNGSRPPAGDMVSSDDTDNHDDGVETVDAGEPVLYGDESLLMTSDAAAGTSSGKVIATAGLVVLALIAVSKGRKRA